MAAQQKGSNWLFRLYKLYTLSKNYTAVPRLHMQRPPSVTMAFRDGRKNKVRMTITRNGKVTVMKNYSFDGCTPKISLFDLAVIGTPDGIRSDKTGKPKAYYASLVHDALYQFLPDTDLYTRKDADDLFHDILEHDEFAPRRIYWLAVRTFGGLFMQARRHITRRTRGRMEVYKKGR